MAKNVRTTMAVSQKRGGYSSSTKPVSGLAPPPRGAAAGARSDSVPKASKKAG